MQTRAYPEQEGKRVWLSRNEQQQIIEVFDEYPDRELALRLGLHGLRSEEIIKVTRADFRQLNGAEAYKLHISGAKGGRERECPATPQLRTVANIYANSTNRRKNEPIIDVTTKALRDWIQEAREELAEVTTNDTWHYVGMHDLRRTWATSTFYSLAFAGVPIAEELTMGWGGWKMTASGRETFRENYLGPEPDHITAKAIEDLPFSET